MTNPIQNSKLYDYILLSGVKSPGLCDITSASKSLDWEERKGFGTAGASLVFKGDKLAKFKVNLRLYTLEDHSKWDDFRTLLLKPINRTRPQAFEIYHPYLADLNIKSVVVEDVSQLVQTGNGEWTVTIEFHQYRRPVPASALVQAAKKDKTTKVTAKTEQEKRIEAKTAVVKGNYGSPPAAPVGNVVSGSI